MSNMFDFLIKNDDDAIVLLKKDHDKVKALFAAFKKAEDELFPMPAAACETKHR